MSEPQKGKPGELWIRKFGRRTDCNLLLVDPNGDYIFLHGSSSKLMTKNNIHCSSDSDLDKYTYIGTIDELINISIEELL